MELMRALSVVLGGSPEGVVSKIAELLVEHRAWDRFPAAAS